MKRPYDILKLKGGKITETTKTEMTGNEKAKLLPTDTGIVVNDFLMEYFPEIMDFNFTANVEKEFDEVAEGEKEWTGMMDSFYKGFHPLVDKTIHSKTEHKVGERVLGTDPVSGKPVSVKIGRFGPVIQIGTADDEEKPRFAQLAKGLSMETITLEEALDAFKLPRTLGDYDGHTVTVGVGRFGPYVRYDKLFVSIPKGTDPMEISLDEAVELIKNKIEAQEKKFIKVFDADPDMQVLNGRYGPYISYQKKNYKIPENVEPADLSLEACFKVIELQKSKAETRKTKAASRNRGTVNMEEESEKPEESAKSKAASKVKGTAKAKKMTRIFLIGYMGAGKTTLGKAFAREMSLNFIDLDWFIEERFHKTVQQLFLERGEDGFRELERKMLHEVAEFEDVVVSTGGGTPCFF